MKATAHDTNVLDVIGEVHQLSAIRMVVQRQHTELLKLWKGLLATYQDFKTRGHDS